MGSLQRIVRLCVSAAFSLLVALGAAGPLGAQIIVHPYPPRRLPPPVPSAANLFDEDDRSGPRLGVAYLIGGSVTAEREGKHVAPLMTLFGWQLEHQFQTGRKDIPVPMTEFILLAGGMEQGIVLPSASLLLGMRQPNGWEAALGPTVTGAGVQLAFGAGLTQSLGMLNIPVNLAVAPGRRGASISFTTGFNRKHGS
jgi:hypothetical protein